METVSIPTLSFKPHHVPLLFTNPPQKWTTMRSKREKAGPRRVLLNRETYGTIYLQLHEDFLQPCYYFDITDKEGFAKSEGYLSLANFEQMAYNFRSRGHYCYRAVLEGTKPVFIYRISDARRNP